jgi:hypothetical protein
VRFLVEGVFEDRGLRAYEVHAESVEAARLLAEGAGVRVTAVRAEPLPAPEAEASSVTSRSAGRPAVLVLAGLAAGFVSAGLGAFPPMLWFVPGVVFAAWVAGPWGWMCGWRAWRIAAVVVLGVVGYVVALYFTTRSQFLAAPVGAALGTGIMLLPAFVDEQPRVRLAAGRALGVGTIAAFLFTGFSFVPGGWAGLLLAIVIWQVVVAAALSTGVPADRQPPNDGVTPPA